MIRIFTDSTSDFSKEQAKALKIDEIIPLRVRFGDEEYLDGVTISNQEFYEKLAKSDVLPTTTCISVNEFLEAFAKYPDDDIIVLGIAEALSATYQSACLAKEMSGRDNIYVIETKAVTLALALLVRIACDLREEGLSAAEICDRLTAIVPKIRLLAAVDTLDYLIKGGRLSRAAGIVAKTLNIKPLITLEEGKVVSHDKARSMKKALKCIMDGAKKAKLNKSYPIYFAQSFNDECEKELRDHFGVQDTSCTVNIGCVVGAHVGPGAVGITFVSDEE